MRKHRLHDIVLGMLLMALVMGLAIPALATYGGKTLDVAYMDIKLVVDGVPITPTDVNGNIVEPFACDGTTYLPIRALGNAIGKEVTWDGNTNTVYIGEVPAGAIKNWVGVAYPYTLDISGGFSWATAEELPNTFKAIEETDATVNPRGHVGGGLEVRVGKRSTEPFALASGDYDYDDEPEIRIQGLHFYLGNDPDGTYKIIVRAMLQDIISDPSDINSIMALIEKADELHAIWSDPNKEGRPAVEELKKLFSMDLTFEDEQLEFKSEHIYQLNCVNVELKESDWPYYHVDLIIKNK